MRHVPSNAQDILSDHGIPESHLPGRTNEGSPQTDEACGAYCDLTVEADSGGCSALRTNPRSWSL